MGRNSKPEPSSAGYGETPATTEPPNYRYQTETQPVSGRAITDSDAMARDIKEGRLSGFVGHGTTLTGETEFLAMLRVDGNLVGTVSSDSGTLIVGTQGQVDANINVAAAMINGTVNGDVIATEKLQLGRTARVIGNIQTPRLIIEEGALLEGSCSMLRAREAHEKNAAAEERSYSQPAATTSSYSTETVEEDESADLFASDAETEDDETSSVDAATA